LRKDARTGRAAVLLTTALALVGGACNLVFGLDPLTYDPPQRINALTDASDGAVEDANDGATDRTILDATPDGIDAGDGNDARDEASDASDAESDSG
jgi:hypothetical protein